jgi:hypothetical protein
VELRERCTETPGGFRNIGKDLIQMKHLFALALSTVGLLGLLTVPRAMADEWNKKTVVTFSGPVEIPGQVLQAGTYVFKLVDSQSDRQIVQVFNKNENHLYATILAVPDYQLQPSGKTIITFEERAAGAPEAVKAWFYPGDNYGDEFVYPKVRAVQLAQQNSKPVPSMNNEMEQHTKKQSQPAVAAMKQAPMKAQKPTGEETEIAEVYAAPTTSQAQSTPAPAPVPSTDRSSNTPTQTAQNDIPTQLPKTASNLPLIALGGLFSLALAYSFGPISRRMS